MFIGLVLILLTCHCNILIRNFLNKIPTNVSDTSSKNNFVLINDKKVCNTT